MRVLGIIGTTTGTKTKLTMNYINNLLLKQFSKSNIEIIDLSELNISYSDGRNYIDYVGDTRYVAELIMSADIIIIGTSIFQASIPGVLKNVFDLLPSNAFYGKIVGTYITAGTSKHFLVIEQQLKPILSFMQAAIVPTYVFIENQDFFNNKIISSDVLTRLDKMVEEIAQIIKYQYAFDDDNKKRVVHKD
ncbi:NADPH-dependent FMN reductase [Virgibacillus dokdonensis]|uniref:NADPH-dependent FMN reductase n=1 Tax=Virgibacillus dokdonensis TaxID=302167 RepID=UPI00098B1912|nr:NADPH-dependent FMN reductase [Virgibacillus dokdonensis]